MASKLQFTQNKVTSNDLLNEMNGVKTLEQKTQNATKTKPENVTKSNLKSEPATGKKVLVNFRINEKLLNDTKEFCDKNYMTLTAGITRALKEMIEGSK